MMKERKFGSIFLNREDDGLSVILMFLVYSPWSTNQLRGSPHRIDTRVRGLNFIPKAPMPISRPS